GADRLADMKPIHAESFSRRVVPSSRAARGRDEGDAARPCFYCPGGRTRESTPAAGAPRASGQDQNSSLTALPPSTILSGRPSVLRFSLRGLILSAWQKVQNRSGTVTGRSRAVVPSAEVAPRTCPPLMPPPARAMLNARGKWSRPL